MCEKPGAPWQARRGPFSCNRASEGSGAQRRGGSATQAAEARAGGRPQVGHRAPGGLGAPGTPRSLARARGVRAPEAAAAQRVPPACCACIRGPRFCGHRGSCVYGCKIGLAVLIRLRGASCESVPLRHNLLPILSNFARGIRFFPSSSHTVRDKQSLPVHGTLICDLGRSKRLQRLSVTPAFAMACGISLAALHAGIIAAMRRGSHSDSSAVI